MSCFCLSAAHISEALLASSLCCWRPQDNDGFMDTVCVVEQLGFEGDTTQTQCRSPGRGLSTVGWCKRNQVSEMLQAPLPDCHNHSHITLVSTAVPDSTKKQLRCTAVDLGQCTRTHHLSAVQLLHGIANRPYGQQVQRLGSPWGYGCPGCCPTLGRRRRAS